MERPEFKGVHITIEANALGQLREFLHSVNEFNTRLRRTYSLAEAPPALEEPRELRDLLGQLHTQLGYQEKVLVQDSMRGAIPNKSVQVTSEGRPGAAATYAEPLESNWAKASLPIICEEDRPMVPGMKCPKCGLMQLRRPTCKACGAVLGDRAPRPNPSRDRVPRAEPDQELIHQPPRESPIGLSEQERKHVEEEEKVRAEARIRAEAARQKVEEEQQAKLHQESGYEAKRDQEISKRQLCGVIGSILLFVGVFAPIVSAPIIGNLNYFQNGRGGGTIVIILAVASLILTFTKKYKGLWFTGLGSFGIMAFTFIKFQIRMSQVRSQLKGLGELALQFVQFQWGWALLILGAALVITAAAMEGEGRKRLEEVMHWLRKVQAFFHTA